MAHGNHTLQPCSRLCVWWWGCAPCVGVALVLRGAPGDVKCNNIISYHGSTVANGGYQGQRQLEVASPPLSAACVANRCPATPTSMEATCQSEIADNYSLTTFIAVFQLDSMRTATCPVLHLRTLLMTSLLQPSSPDTPWQLADLSQSGMPLAAALTKTTCPCSTSCAIPGADDGATTMYSQDKLRCTYKRA
jgi:hypothetical protein